MNLGLVLRPLLWVVGLAACNATGAPRDREAPGEPVTSPDPKDAASDGGVTRLPAACAQPLQLDALPQLDLVFEQLAPELIYYSPRGHDLDGDGQTELITSGGREIPPTGEVLALRSNGSVLWRAAGRKQLYGSPVFIDATRDGVDDVFVGGRNQEFLAIDGKSGALLWQFEDPDDVSRYGFYNFYTAVPIADQSGDGVMELLVSNGGADGFEPFQPRPPGHLLVLDAVNGHILSHAEMPDEKETYMSIVMLPDADTLSPSLLFGTGGETLQGGLWLTTLERVLAGDLADATQLFVGNRKGVIAPPSLTDLNGDGRLDIVMSSFDGWLIAFDGVSHAPLWQQQFEASESYTSPVLGFFNDDDVPDVFAVFLHGTFPEYDATLRVLVDGRDGRVLWQDHQGNFAQAGDVAADLNGDGIDEVLFLSNDYDLANGEQQQLMVLDTKALVARPWGPPAGAVMAAAPWLGDIDADGCLDLVISGRVRSEQGSTGVLQRFRIPAPLPAKLSWGGYLGTSFDATLEASIHHASPPPSTKGLK